MMNKRLLQAGVSLRRGLQAIRPYADVVGSVAEVALSAQRSGLGAVIGLVGVAARGAAQNSGGQWQEVYTGRRGEIACLAFDGKEGYDTRGRMSYAVEGYEILVEGGHVWCTPGFAREAKTEITRLIRARFAGGSRLLVSRSAAAEVSLVAETRPGLDSDTARLVQARVEPVLRARGRRSVLLYGPPGTGKTTAAVWVARQQGDVVLAVGGSGANGLNVLPTVCELLMPEAVILDDVETYQDLPVLLDFLEAESRPPLVILTSNCGPGDSRLSRALLRCDRVDETFEVQGAPDARIGVFRSLPDDVWERIRGWSAASLQEVATRAEIFGLSELDLDEIARREDPGF